MIWCSDYVQEVLKADTSLQRNVDNSKWKGTIALKKEDEEFFPGTRVGVIVCVLVSQPHAAMNVVARVLRIMLLLLGSDEVIPWSCRTSLKLPYSWCMHSLATGVLSL